MKDSDLWRAVFERLNYKYNNVWDKPVSVLDILLEKEFFDVRSPMIKDEQLITESIQVVEEL